MNARTEVENDATERVWPAVAADTKGRPSGGSEGAGPGSAAAAEPSISAQTDRLSLDPLSATDRYRPVLPYDLPLQ